MEKFNLNEKRIIILKGQFSIEIKKGNAVK